MIETSQTISVYMFNIPIQDENMAREKCENAFAISDYKPDRFGLRVTYKTTVMTGEGWAVFSSRTKAESFIIEMTPILSIFFDQPIRIGFN
jgi:hypothetical protein